MAIHDHFSSMQCAVDAYSLVIVIVTDMCLTNIPSHVPQSRARGCTAILSYDWKILKQYHLYECKIKLNSRFADNLLAFIMSCRRERYQKHSLLMAENMCRLCCINIQF